jgi:hypothetical protein
MIVVDVQGALAVFGLGVLFYGPAVFLWRREGRMKRNWIDGESNAHVVFLIMLLAGIGFFLQLMAIEAWRPVGW